VLFRKYPHIPLARLMDIPRGRGGGVGLKEQLFVKEF